MEKSILKLIGSLRLFKFLTFMSFLGLMACHQALAKDWDFSQRSPETWARYEELLEKRRHQQQKPLTSSEEREFFTLRLLHEHLYGWDGPWMMSEDQIRGDSYYHDRSDQQDPEGYPAWARKHRTKMIATYLKAFSNVQKILLIRDFLPHLVESYFETEGGDRAQSQHYLEIIKAAIPDRENWRDPSFRKLNLIFEASDDGRFQVDGIEQDRLAVNSGDTVYFNVLRLAELENFELKDVVQLLLHEFLHMDPSIPLPERDAWSAKVSEWAQSRTWNLKTPDLKKITALALPRGSKLPETIWTRNALADDPVLHRTFQKQLRNSFLIFKEDGKTTRVWDEFYDSFQSFGNFTKRSMKPLTRMNEFSHTWVPWPLVKVQDVRLDSIGRVVVGYTQESTYIGNDRGNARYIPAHQFADGDEMPQLSPVQYKIEHSLGAPDFDTRKVYSSEIPTASFEVYRVMEKGSKRYLNLRLRKSDEIKSLNHDFILVAKDTQSLEQFSIKTTTTRILSPDEILLHYEIPKQSIEVSYVLIPKAEKGHVSVGREWIIRPDDRIHLQGPLSTSKPPIEIKKFAIEERLPDGTPEEQARQLRQIPGGDELIKPQTKKGEPALISLELETGKKISGVTLDVDHQVQNVRIRWNVNVMHLGAMALDRGPQPTGNDLISQTGIGRKYFIDKKSMRLKQNGSQAEIQFLLPFDYTEKIEEGPAFTDKIAWCYTYKSRLKAMRYWDTGYRRIAGAWIHFEDGSVVKVPVGKVPDEMFQTFKLPTESPKEPPKPKTQTKPGSAMRCSKVHSP